MILCRLMEIRLEHQWIPRSLPMDGAHRDWTFNVKVGPDCLEDCL